MILKDQKEHFDLTMLNHTLNIVQDMIDIVLNIVLK